MQEENSVFDKTGTSSPNESDEWRIHYIFDLLS